MIRKTLSGELLALNSIVLHGIVKEHFIHGGMGAKESLAIQQLMEALITLSIFQEESKI